MGKKTKKEKFTITKKTAKLLKFAFIFMAINSFYSLGYEFSVTLPDFNNLTNLDKWLFIIGIIIEFFGGICFLILALNPNLLNEKVKEGNK